MIARFKSWVKPSASDPEIAYRQNILSIVLLALTIPGLIGAIFLVVMWFLGEIPTGMIIAALCIQPFFWLSFWLCRGGRIRLASYITIITFFLMIASVTFILGIGHITMIGLALTVVLTGMLIGFHQAIFFSLLSVVTYALSGYAQQRGILSTAKLPLETITLDSFGLLLGLTTLVAIISLANREMAKAVERKSIAEVLQKSEAQYRSTIDSMGDMIHVVNTDLNFVLANRTFLKNIQQWQIRSDLIGCNIFEVLTFLPDHVREEYQNVLQSGQILITEETTRIGDRDYITETRKIPVSDEGQVTQIITVVRDISSRKQFEQQLLQDAFYDVLTSLPNRALFIDRVERAIERARRHEDFLFAVLFLDLDRLKLVNDSLGHAAGDQLLVSFSRRLGECMRAIDTLARLGGDEFVILVEDVDDINKVILITQRIQEALQAPFAIEGQKIYISVSIGVVLNAETYDRPDDILRDADIAMYRAKAQGKNRFEIFDPSMHEIAVARMDLETQLRHAIANQEFRIHYQPIINFITGNIAGFEALIRWQHPDSGLVPPDKFLNVAIETGLILPIDQWVIREACERMCRWHAIYPSEPPLTINVNLSSVQFAHQGLVDQVQKALQDSNLNPHTLKLEITENIIMDDIQLSTTRINQLHKLGVEVQMDDFGTGYSSLSKLQNFPIDTIKIDRSFISRMGADGENIKLMRTILQLARDMNMVSIAEGVETADQLEQLKALNCVYAQGYYFARPLSAEAAEELLASAPRW